MERVIRFFLFQLSAPRSHCEKYNNYLNVKEKNLKIDIWVASAISYISLGMEFAKMFFWSLLQAKGIFL
jgi:hypothetical protein